MRRAAQSTNTALLVGILILMIAVVNVASHRWFLRADLTSNKEYTITPATRRVLGELTDIVNVRVYFSKNLPPYLLSLQRRTIDLLEDMRAYAGENLRIEVTDPAADPKLEAKVRSLGIPQIQLQVIEKDKASVRNAYLGIAVQYEDRTQAIPIVRPEELEYDLVSALLKVTRKEQPAIAFISSADRTFERGYSRVHDFLSREYMVRALPTGTGEKIPDDVKTLVVAGPIGLSERDAFEIDQFVMRGGRLLVMVDPVRDPIQVLSGMMQALPAQSGLEGTLEAYGLRAPKEMVLDQGSHAMISYLTTIGMLQLSTTRPYPPFLQLTSKSLSQKNPAVSQLERIVVPWSSPLETVDPLPEGVVVDTLGRTSDKAWVQAGRFTLSPQSTWSPPDPDKQKSMAVCLAATGRFKSAFAGKPVPALPGDSLGAAADASRQAATESPQTQVVLVGSSYVMDDNMIAQYPENATFVLNLVDWMTLGDELIGIRSRDVTDRPLRELSDSARAAVRFAGIFGTPVLVILYGLFRALAKRRAKRIALQGTAA